MKKNFKNLGLILGMVAVTSFTMTSCAEAVEEVKTEAEGATEVVTEEVIEVVTEEVAPATEEVMEVVTEEVAPATEEVSGH